MVDQDLKDTIERGTKFFENKEFEKAERIFLDALKKKETMPDIHNLLGLVYHEQGRFSKAVKEFSRALELNPNYTEASLNLALISSDIGMHAEAKKAMDRITAREKSKGKGSLDPYVASKIANLHIEIGDIYKSLGHTANAKNEYERALALCPDFPDTIVKLANVTRDEKDYLKAIELYKRAESLGKKYSSVGLNLGITYYSMGQREKAFVEWKKVLKSDPDNILARTYLKLSEKK